MSPFAYDPEPIILVVVDSDRNAVMLYSDGYQDSDTTTQNIQWSYCPC